MSLFIFLAVVLASIAVAATIVIVLANNRFDDLEKLLKNCISISDVEKAVSDAWDRKVTDTLGQLTSEDVLAETLSLMSEEQMDRLADKTAKLREQNE